MSTVEVSAADDGLVLRAAANASPGIKGANCNVVSDGADAADGSLNIRPAPIVPENEGPTNAVAYRLDLVPGVVNTNDSKRASGNVPDASSDWLQLIGNPARPALVGLPAATENHVDEVAPVSGGIPPSVRNR